MASTLQRCDFIYGLPNSASRRVVEKMQTDLALLRPAFSAEVNYGRLLQSRLSALLARTAGRLLDAGARILDRIAAACARGTRAKFARESVGLL